MIIANEMHVEINDFKKNCIVFTSDTESNCQGGMSKIGGNPDVFDPKRRPWVDLSKADAKEIGEIIDRCPSKALQYELKL